MGARIRANQVGYKVSSRPAKADSVLKRPNSNNNKHTTFYPLLVCLHGGGGGKGAVT